MTLGNVIPLGIIYKLKKIFMSVLINFKICDNAKECLGIEVCPTKALYWDEKKETIAFDESKCSLCKMCEEACEMNAIKVAANKEEYEKYKKEINDDTRQISDLFIDRYGAKPIHLAFLLKPEKFDIEVLESNKLVVVEVYKEDSIECLLNSIPIKWLFKNKNIKFRKIKETAECFFEKKYKVESFPSLLFFQKGELVGKIEGFYGIKQKEKLLDEINELGLDIPALTGLV